MVDIVIRLPEVARRCGVAKITIQKWVKQGKFPKPLKLATHAIGWRESTVDEWLRIQEDVSSVPKDMRRLL